MAQPTLVVAPQLRPLVGSVPVPSDKSIGHRAVLLAGLANGISELRGFSHGEDNVATARALVAMGATIEGLGARDLRVKGVGLFGLHEPAGALDCGNSGTTMRLLSGVLAAQPFQSVLVGDASLSRRPMMRVVGPLRARGAILEGAPHPRRQGEITAPLRIGPLGEDVYLGPLSYESPFSSAQVKSALLLSGLFAHGVTLFKEPLLSRDHTERLLLSLGVPLRTSATVVELDPAGWSGQLPAFELDLPGDPSAAAFLVVAAQLVPGSRVTARSVCTNPTRTGLFEIARGMGAGIEVSPLGERGGEPVGDVSAWYEPHRGMKVGGELVPRAIDEIPVLCALAARGHGTTRITNAEELRVKESDRIAAMAGVLRAFGVRCEELPDGLEIEGTQTPLRAAEIDSLGDHRIAMTAAVLGLLAEGPSRVRDVACIATSFPRFAGTLRALGASIRVEEG